jgi:4a-hydroxytetrahydrobiopterin dehydratase
MAESLTRPEIVERLPDGWELLSEAIEARYDTGDFATGLAFVARVGEAAEAADHHPDVTLTYPAVHIRTFSHDVGQVTGRDIALATAINRIAAELGLASAPDQLSRIEFALDAHDRPAVGAFWAAVLGYDLHDIDVSDPHGRQVPLWFQQTDSHDPGRQRFHVDFWVPADQAQARIDAAVAAGGKLVSDDEAPAFTVIEDPEGNKICVCTNESRD